MSCPAAITLDEGAAPMLYAESVFTTYTGAEVTDLTTSHEVMNGFAAESREQVDEVADKALAAARRRSASLRHWTGCACGPSATWMATVGR